MQIHVHVKIILCSPFTIKFSFVSHSTKKELEKVIKRLEDMQENMMIEWKVAFLMQFINLLWMQIMSENCHFSVEWSPTANQYLRNISSQQPFQSFGAFATLKYLKIWMVFNRFDGYFVQSFS